MRLREFTDHSYWHGSDLSGLTDLEPRYSELVGEEVVFAAVYPEVAVAMSGHWTDDDFEFGRKSQDHDDHTPYTMRELRKGAFVEFFSDPVILYEVEPNSFRDHPKIQDFEVISTKSVRIIDQETIDDPMRYLRQSKMVRLQFYREIE